MYYVGITLAVLALELLSVSAIAGGFYMYERLTAD